MILSTKSYVIWREYGVCYWLENGKLNKICKHLHRKTVAHLPNRIFFSACHMDLASVVYDFMACEGPYLLFLEYVGLLQIVPH